ncbi:Adhesion G protein-coupled receptor L3 [Nymphon striatum]|nr:Adhesion G protein-coupled receptor L3 [Nymphon striatum]
MTENAILFAKRSCFCDKNCKEYGDCCIDVAERTPTKGLIRNYQMWTCAKIPVAFAESVDHIYIKGKCPQTWSDTYIKSKCEMDLQIKVDYMQQIPVLGKRTNITYTNVYCAICNNDDEIHQWNVTVSCEGGISEKALKNSNFLSITNYNSASKSWNFFYKNKTSIICSFYVSDFFQNYAMQTNARACKPKINSCPKNWSNIEDSTRCSQYASYRYSRYKIYNNEYCVKCNDITNTDVSCFQLKRRRVYSSSRPVSSLDDYGSSDYGYRDYPSISVLFHIKHQTEDKCKATEIFDLLRNRCIKIKCGRLFKLEGGHCIKDTSKSFLNNSITSDCETISLLPGEYSVSSNQSIWVNHTQKIYGRGEYEFSDSENQSTMVLSICKESHYVNLNDFVKSQAIISEICLYISTVCLMLHLISYVLIPKLRNLPGKNLMSLSVSLLLAQSTFIYGINKISNPVVCKTVAACLHFFFLAYFFWLNVMAIDICRTFKTNSKRNTASKKTFYCYSIYVWLATALIVTCSLVADNTSVFNDKFNLTVTILIIIKMIKSYMHIKLRYQILSEVFCSNEGARLPGKKDQCMGEKFAGFTIKMH